MMEDELARIRERWDFSEREPTTPWGHDIRLLLAALEKAEAERDAAYRTIADAVANNIGHETSIRRAEWVSKHSAVIEAARKMGDE